MPLARLKKILVVLLLSINLYYIQQFWVDSMNIPDRGVHALDRWEAQMVLARKALPIKRGVIGYITEQDMPGVENANLDIDWDTETELFLTQYALAPLIIKKGPVAEWNVVVLDDEDLAIWKKAYSGPYEIINIKGKVHILHRLDNP
jgi:hypothetical protein